MSFLDDIKQIRLFTADRIYSYSVEDFKNIYPDWASIVNAAMSPGLKAWILGKGSTMRSPDGELVLSIDFN